MTNIFAEKYNLYPPEDKPVLEYYKEYFDEVFISLIPFSKLNFEKIRDFKENEIFDKRIEEIKHRIFDENRLKNYPLQEEFFSDIEEYYFTEKINWDQIIKNSEIKNFKDLNKALMTSIGALKKELEEHIILETLQNFAKRDEILIPSEGSFDVHSKIGIYNCLFENNISQINVIEEFHESQKKIDLSNISIIEFIEKINFKDYYIFSEDKQILFSIDWDYFFFFIGINSQTISKESIEKNFNGFWANIETTHLWTWEKGEINKKLKLK